MDLSGVAFVIDEQKEQDFLNTFISKQLCQHKSSTYKGVDLFLKFYTSLLILSTTF